jgi:hypothetical protein
MIQKGLKFCVLSVGMLLASPSWTMEAERARKIPLEIEQVLVGIGTRDCNDWSRYGNLNAYIESLRPLITECIVVFGITQSTNASMRDLTYDVNTFGFDVKGLCFMATQIDIDPKSVFQRFKGAMPDVRRDAEEKASEMVKHGRAFLETIRALEAAPQ